MKSTRVIIIFAIVLFFDLHLTNAIKCFHCTNLANANCTNELILQSPNIDIQLECSGDIKTCYKAIVVQITPTITNLFRGCGSYMKYNDLLHHNIKGVEPTEYHECDKDLCNSGNQATAFGIFGVISFIIAFHKLV